MQKKNKFKDIKTTDELYQYIQELADKGYITGYADNTFRPKNSITRTEFLKLLFLIKGVGISENSMSHFIDIVSGSWQNKYVNTALERGIISKNNKRFYPNNSLTRVEALKMAIILFTGEIENTYHQELLDVGGSEWYAKYVQFALDKKLLEANRGYFYPTKNITRYEVIHMLNQLSK